MPDDPFISEMDPVQWRWMYHSWEEDQNDKGELAKSHAYLLGSFWNPEAVKEMMGGGNTIISSDDEFEMSSKMVKDSVMDTIPSKKKKKKLKR